MVGGVAVRQLIAALRRRLSPIAGTIEGYEHPELVEVVFRKTIAYQPQAPWPEMIGVTSVLDFGGGCWLHYKQAQSPDVKWAVVETPAMIARASELATDNLRFFTSISDTANWLGSIDVMYSNSVLQYTPEPRQTLKQLCSLRAKKMLWERLSLSADSVEREIQSSRLSDNGPCRLRVKEKIMKYERIKLPEPEFLAAHSDYELAERGTDWFRFLLRI
jgi:putative methyltransferase (TIGR04325 family)